MSEEMIIWQIPFYHKNKIKQMKLNIMKRNIKLLITTVILGAVIIVACNKKLDVTDQNNPTTDSYFKTALELQNGVNAVYSTLRSANLVGREWFFTHDMRGGETNSGGAQLEAPRAERKPPLNQTPGAVTARGVFFCAAHLTTTVLKPSNPSVGAVRI